MNLAKRVIKGSVGEVGFGKAGERGRTRRLLNRNGTFNIERTGISPICSLSLYHILITTSWPIFFAILALAYILTNLFFGLMFFSLGPEALGGTPSSDLYDRLSSSFFFSVQTLATIGYGIIHPKGLIANSLVTVESVVGLLESALITGLFFARFSRPSARILFSDKAVFAQYRGALSLQFRMVNARKSQLLEPSVQVVLAWLETKDGKESRAYYQLKLILDRVIFFPAYWTITHAIDESSPLFGVSTEEIQKRDIEIMVLLKATEETFSQHVHARTSYKFQELEFNKRFAPMYAAGSADSVAVDVSQLSVLEAD